MKTIWKFPLKWDSVNEVRGPGAIEPLHFGIQNDVPCLWAAVDPDADTETGRLFQIFGTGHDIPPSTTYVGTAFDEPFVWHLFEVQP